MIYTFINNKRDFAHNLLLSPGICPHCNTILIFGENARFAKANNNLGNVVVCKNCNRVFEAEWVPASVILKRDVTEKYPNIKPKR